MPSAIHDSIIQIFSYGFVQAKMALQQSIRRNTAIFTNKDYNGFSGSHSGSQKTPDLSIDFRELGGKSGPRFIIEVGVSESYEDLVRDARLWLEGCSTVRIVCLIKFTEEPEYRCLARDLSDSQVEELNFPPPTEINITDF